MPEVAFRILWPVTKSLLLFINLHLEREMFFSSLCEPGNQLLIPTIYYTAVFWGKKLAIFFCDLRSPTIRTIYVLWDWKSSIFLVSVPRGGKKSANPLRTEPSSERSLVAPGTESYLPASVAALLPVCLVFVRHQRENTTSTASCTYGLRRSCTAWLLPHMEAITAAAAAMAIRRPRR